MKQILLGVGLFGISTFAMAKVPCFELHAANASALCRPLRTNLIKIDRSLDETKPVAPADLGGWVMSGDLLIGAYNDRWLGAWSAKTMEPVWFAPLSEGLSSPITLVANWVVVSTKDGVLSKIETATGQRVWESRVGRAMLTPMSFHGSTLLGVTVAQQLIAIDFQTGATHWVFELSSGESQNLLLQNAVTPIVSDRQVIAGATNGEIHGVNLEDGVSIWRVNPGATEARFSDVVGELAMDGEHVLFARYDGIVGAIDVKSSDHRVVWKEQLPSASVSAFRSGAYYVGTVAGDIQAFEAASGHKQWSTGIGQAITSLTIGEKYLYVGGTSGRVAALDRENGALMWIDDIEGIVTRFPVVLNDQIFFATGMRVLYGYKLL